MYCFFARERMEGTFFSEILQFTFVSDDETVIL